MTEVYKLIEVLQKVRDLKAKAVKLKLFEVSAAIRDNEKLLIVKICELTEDAERIINFADVHFQQCTLADKSD